MSSECGLASDPENMLHAQVVKMNGQFLWASEEPDLLWALTGGGAFGKSWLNVVCPDELTVPESRRRSETEGLPVSFINL